MDLQQSLKEPQKELNSNTAKEKNGYLNCTLLTQPYTQGALHCLIPRGMDF